MPNAIAQKEEKTENKWIRFGELWNNIKHSSISVTWVPEGGEKKEWKVIWKSNGQIFWIWKKSINLHIQETQRIPK